MHAACICQSTSIKPKTTNSGDAEEIIHDIKTRVENVSRVWGWCGLDVFFCVHCAYKFIWCKAIHSSQYGNKYDSKNW